MKYNFLPPFLLLYIGLGVDGEREMFDYLVFNKFIAQDILIIAYYFGALFIPLFFWYIRGSITKRVLFIQDVVNNLYNNLSKKEKIKLWFIFMMLFFCAELCWRLVFEAMIGYFDMHNYLYEITKYLK